MTRVCFFTTTLRLRYRCAETSRRIRATPSPAKGIKFLFISANRELKIPPCGGRVIAGPWHDNRRMPLNASLRIVLMDCANRAMVANRCNVFLCQCRCISHIGAGNRFGWMCDRCRWCILRPRFDSWRRFAPVLWMI